MRASALRHSIGTKIFGAFLAMTFIIAGLGAYGYHVLVAAGTIVADTYDHPMMAINFARAASVDFLQMENDALRAEKARPAERAKLMKDIALQAQTLHDDLAVADERATAQDERSTIRRIRTLVRSWLTEHNAALSRGWLPDFADLDQKILDQFDLLIEFNADHGFVSRREAIGQVAGFEGAVIGLTAIALLFAIAITIFLARRIVRPLQLAAQAADRIAGGEFETDIPSSGRDETGALLQSMHVMQDSIRAQMAREMARAQSAEGRLVDAIENSGEGIILADGSGNIAVANSELARLFPDIADQIVAGKPLAVALAQIESCCRSDSSPELPLAHELDARSAVAPAWTELQLPDGRWLRITARATSEGGSILFFSDFTDIKQREERYRAAKRQAEAANAAKSRFLANMSHELRTPLNAIIGFSELLSGQIFGPLGNPRYSEYASDILKSGRNLLSVVNAVLDLARTESGTCELSKGTVDLRRLLRELCVAQTDACASAGLTLVQPEDGEPVLIEADEMRLRQIVSNLLSNAIRFTESGQVSVSFATRGRDVVIEIRDTGIGMSAEDIETALTPFAQVDGRLARRYEGAGLGLPLARALTELHGGKLSIESAKGLGTKVTVSLPKAVRESELESDRDYEPETAHVATKLA